jgi:hypothetical protein
MGGRNHWPLSELINYEREVSGQPPEPSDPANEKWLTAAQVLKRYGGRSQMWLHRRTAETKAARAKQQINQSEMQRRDCCGEA